MAPEEKAKKSFLRDKIVFFMGAGSSRYLGYPLMSSFLDDMKQAFPQVRGLPRQKKAFEVLLAFRGQLASVREYVNTDFDNIEALYSAAEMFGLAFPEEQIDVGAESVPGAELPEWIALAIWSMCRWRGKHEEPQRHGELLKRLVELAQKTRDPDIAHRVAFVTTNYDMGTTSSSTTSTSHSSGRLGTPRTSQNRRRSRYSNYTDQ